jgi:hypothetical protein
VGGGRVKFMFQYIIKGDCFKAVAVKSEMNHMEMGDYVREHSKKIHNESYDRVFSLGAIDIVNPKVMSPNDFANCGPYII